VRDGELVVRAGPGCSADTACRAVGGLGGKVLTGYACLSPRPPGTSLEQAAAAPPPWARPPAARERLKAATAAARALAKPPARGGGGGGGGGSGGDGDGGGAGAGARAPALNLSQAAAVAAALGRTLTLWQGPPGTGKTATLLQLCRAALPALPTGGQVRCRCSFSALCPVARFCWLCTALVACRRRGLPAHCLPHGPHPLRPFPLPTQILAVAASNVAVDNIVAGLVGLGMRVVRVGQPVKVRPRWGFGSGPGP
jgi:hypothetical protein